MSRNIFHILNRVFFPNRCYICARDADDELCRVCRSLCRAIFGNQGSIKSVFYYDDTIRKLVLGAKVGHKPHFGHLLANLFREMLPLSSFYRELIEFNASAIVLVPGRRVVLYQRGFELTILLARALQSMINVPIVPLLLYAHGHSKMSRIQHKNERFHAIQGSFSLRFLSQHKRLILMDDIVTSGATLNEAKKTLRPLKAQIFCLTVAKTPFTIPNIS